MHIYHLSLSDLSFKNNKFTRGGSSVRLLSKRSTIRGPPGLVGDPAASGSLEAADSSRATPYKISIGRADSGIILA